jgi:hypothetical protein
MVKASRLVIAALIAVGLPASMVATPASAALAHHQRTVNSDVLTNVISGLNPGLCLDDYHGGTGNLNNVDVYQCNGSAAQIWDFQPVGTDSYGTIYEIHAGVDSKMCLDDYGGRTNNFNNVDIYQCNGSLAQQWVLVGKLNLAATLNTRANSDLTTCLDVYHSGTANFTNVDVYQCNGTAAQWWSVYTN